jgi:hypothetical protein
MQLYVSKFSFGTHTKSNWKWIPLTSLYHCIICAALVRLEVEGIKYLFYFSVIFFVHLHSDLKVPYLNLTAKKIFAKTYTSEAFLFCKIYQLLIKNTNQYVNP